MKKIFIVGCGLLLAGVLSSMKIAGKPPVEEAPVKWMTFEEAVEKSKTEKRKIFVDVYTDWCGWCKVMDKKTFSDPKVAKILKFKFVGEEGRGTHQLAAALLSNQMSYPTVVFLDEEFRIIQPLAGFREAPEFHKIAQFIGEGHYKTQKWADWQASYKSPF
jgi:thiol:disulfide interchange protein